MEAKMPTGINVLKNNHNFFRIFYVGLLVAAKVAFHRAAGWMLISRETPCRDFLPGTLEQLKDVFLLQA